MQKYKDRYTGLYNNIKFLKDPFFVVRGEEDAYDADKILSKIASGRNLLMDRNFDDEDLGALQLLFSKYINEIWISEEPPQNRFKTEEIIDCLFEPDNDISKTEEVFKRQGWQNPQKVAQIIHNLLSGSQFLFGKDFKSYVESPFSVELAKEVHKHIANGIIDNGGEFRKKFVGASGSSVSYSLPKDIEARMNSLFEWTRDQVETLTHLNDVERTREMFKIGAIFFSDFLLIHPFVDGNGRTARLLLNFLLRNTTIVPFSVYIRHPLYEPRNIYLDCLEERNTGHSPSSLLTLILHSAYLTLATLEYLF